MQELAATRNRQVAIGTAFIVEILRRRIRLQDKGLETLVQGVGVDDRQVSAQQETIDVKDGARDYCDSSETCTAMSEMVVGATSWASSQWNRFTSAASKTGGRLDSGI